VALRAFITLPPIRPIVPVPCDEPFDHPDWLFEPKYDGVRGLLYVTRRECHFLSKTGDVLARFQELAYRVREELPVKEAILDGEIVALDRGGRQSFRELVAGGGHLHYAAFDALWLRGRDLRGLPLGSRKRALHRLIPAATTVLSQVFSVEERGRDAVAAAQRLDLEGVVAKRKADPYVPGTIWYEILNRQYTQRKGRGELSAGTGDRDHADDP
jgi:bifunctional non-homologous end joining protein LigD